MQFDEKWAFVAKKEKHCDRNNADDDHCGDCWDYIALDPEHRLVVSALVGRHSAEHVDLLVEDFKKRTGGKLMNLMTSDENPAYAEANVPFVVINGKVSRQGEPDPVVLLAADDLRILSAWHNLQLLNFGIGVGSPAELDVALEQVQELIVFS